MLQIVWVIIKFTISLFWGQISDGFVADDVDNIERQQRGCCLFSGVVMRSDVDHLVRICYEHLKEVLGITTNSQFVLQDILRRLEVAKMLKLHLCSFL